MKTEFNDSKNLIRFISEELGGNKKSTDSKCFLKKFDIWNCYIIHNNEIFLCPIIAIMKELIYLEIKQNLFY